MALMKDNLASQTLVAVVVQALSLETQTMQAVQVAPASSSFVIA